MPTERDVKDFEARAASYDFGRLGKVHREIVERALGLALAACPSPERALDVGCGTGYLLRLLAERCPDAVELIGVDPAAAMIAVAEASAPDERTKLLSGIGAEHLPFADGTFDLITATTSFDHWSDQRAGLNECARVLCEGGSFVLVDQISPWLAPTLLVRRGKARTKRRVDRLLAAAGFSEVSWRSVYSPIIQAAVATA